MTEERVNLQIPDVRAAIRYLGEMQSRPMDPIHEPIQNLLDAEATKIDVILDAKKHVIRIRGTAKPISSLSEAKRILSSICASSKVDKLGEKGVGMLSFVTIGTSMTTLSQQAGKIIWFTLDRDDLSTGKIGSERGNQLPYSGTEVTIKGISPRNLKYRFSEDRVIKDIKRRWGAFLTRGIYIAVNGRDVGSFSPPLKGDRFERVIKVKELGKNAAIEVSLLVLNDPSDLATVSVTHRGQANFIISDVPLFDSHNAFTQGMLHGTITGDIAPINASRTGFQEGREFNVWVDQVVNLDEELGRLIEDKIKTATEARDAEMLDEWMKHLKDVFRDTELASTFTSSGKGEDEGWGEIIKGEGESSGGESGREVSGSGRKGGPGRLPTLPYAGFTKAPPNIRVVRDRKAFRINVNHKDFICSSKQTGGRRKYIREVCMQEAFIYSLEGEQQKQYIERSDEYLGFWTKAFIGR